MAVNVPIISSFDSRGIERALRDFKRLQTGSEKAAFGLRTMDKAAVSFAKQLTKMVAIGGAVAGVIGQNLVSAASNLQEAQNKVTAVFGESAQEIQRWADGTARSLGISERAALEAVGTYGNLFRAFGMSAGAAQEMSVRLVELAADMASFNNVPIDEALLALRSGLSGETEPLKRFGVALSDVRLREEAVRIGLLKTARDAMPLAVKTQAAYSLILKDTAIQQGDVARTSDGLAFQIKSAQAQFEDLRAELGQQLIPVFNTLFQIINKQILPTLSTFATIVGQQGIGSGLNFLAGSVLRGISSMGMFGKVILTATTAFVALRVATMTYMAVQSALKIATAVTTGALNAQISAINGTKVAMIAAGGVAAAISIAAMAYGQYAINKAKAAQATSEFVAMLKLEGAEQQKAYSNLLLNNKGMREGSVVLQQFGIDMADVIAYTQGANNEVSAFVAQVLKAPGGTDWLTGDGGIVGALERMRENMPELNKLTQDQQVALYHALVAIREYRKGVEENKQAQLELAIATGNTNAIIAAQHALFVNGHPSLRRTMVATDGTAASTSALDAEMKKLLDDMGKVPTSVGGAARTVETFSQKVGKMVDVMRGATSAQRSLRDATKATQDAQAQQAQATANLSRAQANFDRITRGLGAAARESQDQATAVGRAQREQERSAYALEAALFAIQDAERSLAVLRQDPTATPRQIREAEIALAESKLALADRTDEQRQATQALSDAELRYDEIVNGAKVGSDAYAAALDELNAAKRDLEQATDAVADAILRERDAVLALAEAEEKLAEARRKSGKKVVGAAAARVAADAAMTLPSQRVPGGINAADPSGFGGLPLTPFANGGIVLRPMAGLVGEAGPEAIIPLDQLPGIQQAQGIEINIYSTIADDSLPEKIVSALQTYNRRVGPARIQIRS
jgi:hypothetical protein